MNASHKLKQGRSLLTENLTLQTKMSSTLSKTKSDISASQQEQMRPFGHDNSDQLGALRNFDEEAF